MCYFPTKTQERLPQKILALYGNVTSNFIGKVLCRVESNSVWLTSQVMLLKSQIMLGENTFSNHAGRKSQLLNSVLKSSKCKHF
jgi:hypothetical protein